MNIQDWIPGQGTKIFQVHGAANKKRRNRDKGVDGDNRGIKRQNNREAEADGRVHWYKSWDRMLLSVTQTPPCVFLKAQYYGT